MKKISNNLKIICDILNDCQFHSGEEIAKHLHITRSAVWKYISKLETLGVNILSSLHKGYRFKKPLYLFDEHKIKTHINAKTQKEISHIDVLHTVDSTNTYLKEHYNKNFSVVIAEQQTSGRGRLGRKWISPFGQNIYLSCLWCINKDIGALGGLSIIVGLSIVATLQELDCQNISMKWPNDLLWDNKKLGGILIDVFGETNSFTKAIIGIGLNINDNPNITGSTCLRKNVDRFLDRNIIVGKVLNNLHKYLEQYSKNDLQYFMPQWKEVDYLYHKPVTIKQHDSLYKGIGCGIDKNGHFVIKNKNKTHIISAGDASIYKK